MEIHVVVQHIEDGAHHLLMSAKKEASNTRDAGAIIKKFIETGAITEDEEKILKIQLADTLKIAGIVIPFVLIPGASVIMPIFIKVAAKHNINLMPSVI